MVEPDANRISHFYWLDTAILIPILCGDVWLKRPTFRNILLQFGTSLQASRST